jgi:hypothetical protein
MDQAKYALPRYPQGRIPKQCEGASLNDENDEDDNDTR